MTEKAPQTPPPFSPATHRSLLIRLKPGSPTREVAWEEFHEKYSPIIAAFARELGVRSAADVDEVVQDVISAFFLQSATFEYDPAKGRFRSFLKVMTIRILCKKRGRDAKFRGAPIDTVDVQAPELDSMWEDIWARQRMRQALESLRQRYAVNPDRARTFRAFELYVLEQADADDVANNLGIGVNSVYQAKHRVSSDLQRMLDDLQERDG